MDYIVGMGGNLGDPPAAFLSAEAALGRSPGLRLCGRSRLYRTAPVGPPQPDFHNAALLLGFEGEPEALLERLQQVERAHGRDRAREERWGPRTLDLDLLYRFGPPLASPRLTVPHPELERRSFALAPLLDLAPTLRPSYGPLLDALGGAPPVIPWPDTSP